MGGKFNLNGNVYDIVGGKYNLNGTIYDIVGGKRNVNGTIYEITFGEPQPMVLPQYAENNFVMFYSDVPFKMKLTNTTGKKFYYSYSDLSKLAEIKSYDYAVAKKFADGYAIYVVGECENSASYSILGQFRFFDINNNLISNAINVYGDFRNLINYKNWSSISYSDNLTKYFFDGYYAPSLKDVSNLKVPIADCNRSCEQMFNGQTNIVRLPMFEYLTSTYYSNYICTSMFRNCTSLKEICRFKNIRFNGTSSLQGIFQNANLLTTILERPQTYRSPNAITTIYNFCNQYNGSEWVILDVKPNTTYYLPTDVTLIDP